MEKFDSIRLDGKRKIAEKKIGWEMENLCSISFLLN